MVNSLNPKEWLNRSKSCLVYAKNVDKDDLKSYGGFIYYEELCYNLQQSVEKALKALLLYNGIEIQKTHSITNLTRVYDLCFPECLASRYFLIHFP